MSRVSFSIEISFSKPIYVFISTFSSLFNHSSRAVGVVPTWHTLGAQGSDYATIEEPGWATQLTNLARAHALTQGRNYLTLEDVPSAIKAYVISRKNNNF